MNKVHIIHKPFISQSLSSEDELDVTVEVCRPSTSPAEEKQDVENSLSGIQMKHPAIILLPDL